MPSWLKSKDPEARFCSGRVASSLALGVQDSHRFDPDALNKACAVMFVSYSC